MVLMFEIAFLVVCVTLGWLWFRRTNTYRSRRRSFVEPGQHDGGARESTAKMPPKEGFGNISGGRD
jgi:hypothetical protein